MANSKVRARRGSIKFTDLLLAKYDETSMPGFDVLESLGLCVTLNGWIVPVGFYERLSALSGGIE